MINADPPWQHWLTSQLPELQGLDAIALRAEASNRSFYRITNGAGEPSGRVLMVSPPDKEQNEQFEILARVFRAGGIAVPEILARDAARGWYLLTDLGHRDLEAAYAGPEREQALTAAIGTLVRLQQLSDPHIPPYTAERFTDELGIFSEWFAGAVLNLAPPPGVAETFELLVDNTDTQTQCCVHRDYHCRNLLYNKGVLSVVDFQDALMGPVSYDPASLLHDCYHEFPAAEVARWIRVYLKQAPWDLDPARFAIDVDLMAVQRQLKAIGIFARLKLRDGRGTHLPYILPVLDRTRRIATSHPDLAPLADWLETLRPGPALSALADGGLPP